MTQLRDDPMQTPFDGEFRNPNDVTAHVVEWKWEGDFTAWEHGLAGWWGRCKTCAATTLRLEDTPTATGEPTPRPDLHCEACRCGECRSLMQAKVDSYRRSTTKELEFARVKADLLESGHTHTGSWNPFFATDEDVAELAEWLKKDGLDVRYNNARDADRGRVIWVEDSLFWRDWDARPLDPEQPSEARFARNPFERPADYEPLEEETESDDHDSYWDPDFALSDSAELRERVVLAHAKAHPLPETMESLEAVLAQLRGSGAANCGIGSPEDGAALDAYLVVLDVLCVWSAERVSGVDDDDPDAMFRFWARLVTTAAT